MLVVFFDRTDGNRLNFTFFRFANLLFAILVIVYSYKVRVLLFWHNLTSQNASTPALEGDGIRTIKGWPKET